MSSSIEATVPYLFDMVFAIDGGPSRGPAAYGAEDHEKALAEGREEGLREAAQSQAASLSAAAEQIGSGITGLLGQADADRQRIEDDAVRLALAAARKLAGSLVEREPAADIEVLARECLGKLRDAPHLVVRVSEDLAEALRERIAGQRQETGFEGRLVVLSEPDIALGDARIEWVDGGTIRDTAAIERALDEAVAAFLNRSAEAPASEISPTEPVDG